jgi:18S rRNA (guanine1575-N7)-methyltransferase
MSRPELQAPPESYYGEEEANKYTERNRIIKIQTEMAERCMQLLELPSDEGLLLLDIGCGSGLSGDIITEEGHYWFGMDISKDMMRVAVDREVEGELFECDIGQGFNFLPGKFDAAISVSVIQWLCNVDKTGHNAWRRLLKFFGNDYFG